jgi:hypothetical protein
MLAMCEQLGFRVKDDPDEPGIKIVKLDLQKLPGIAGKLPV